MEPVTIVEVGPRDGLQNEKRAVPTAAKLRLIALCAAADLARIEATAFVSPKWVPQMADHDRVMRAAARRPGLALSALVPNEKGAAAAIEAGAQALAVFTGASETFVRRNINCAIAESIGRFRPVMALAAAHGLPVRGYVSCAVDCPYEGPIAPEAVRDVACRLRDIGCREIAVADTIGRAAPGRVARMLDAVVPALGAASLAGHFHDTAGQALANVDVALARGIRVFDGAAGGLGGCPYAPGAAGNLRTGALVAHLAAAGHATGVDPAALAEAEAFAASLRG